MISLSSDTPVASFTDEISAFFSDSGPLSRFPDFEMRVEQQVMATAVARNLQLGGHLIVEAGTGVGKSLAYLIPAVLFAKRNRRKAIVSTHTINLQEQLLQKDVPLVRQILDLPFEAALLKGRQNYLCSARLDRAIAHASGLFTNEQVPELERVRAWSLETPDGTLSELPFPVAPDVWSEICSERHSCTGRTCADNPRCFYQRARRLAQKAEVLVLNHALFFTLLAGVDEETTDADGYLFPDDFAIFDEAHHIEAAASQLVGIGVSQYGLRHALNRLYNPRTHKGLLAVVGAALGRKSVETALAATNAFFQEMQLACRFEKGREFRIRDAGIVDGSTLCGSLADAADGVSGILKQCDNESIAGELRDARVRLLETRDAVVDFLQMKRDAHVYWVEQSGKAGTWLNLNAAPIDVAGVLRQMLFREGACSTCTSATLSIGKADLSYFQNRVGAEDVPAISVGSPFDYQRQMSIHIVRKMPDPRETSYEEALEKWICHFTDQSRGRAFVLFTSHRTLRSVAQRVEPHFKKQGWPLITQGTGASRTQMVKDFRASGSAVLFGTDSFWSGVDVPGEALSNVIITRLPFAQPDHPLTEAKLEHIEEKGGDPFQRYSLPEAILKLRQGVGRLIRTRRDSGIVVILDSRIVTKPYGRAFLSALPTCPIEYY